MNDTLLFTRGDDRKIKGGSKKPINGLLPGFGETKYFTGGDRGGVLAGDPNGADAPGPISLLNTTKQGGNETNSNSSLQASIGAIC